MQLTVVIPTFNEAENLPKLVSALFALPIENLKILVVDDNSPDGTGQLAEELAQTHPGRMDVLHRPGKLGLGSAYIQGFRHAIEAGAEAVGQMDADFSHSPEKLPVLLETLQCCDIAIGSRYVTGGSVDIKWPLWRKALSAFGNFYARTILRLPLRDVTGGFRVWRSATLSGMPLESITLEWLCLPGRDGLRSLSPGLYFQRDTDLLCRPEMGNFENVVPDPA